MRTLILNTKYLHHAEAKAVPGKYESGQLALRFKATAGMYPGEPLITATINGEPYKITVKPRHILLKTVNENEGIVETLIQNGVIETPIRWYNFGGKPNGIVEAPLTYEGFSLFQ